MTDINSLVRDYKFNHPNCIEDEVMAHVIWEESGSNKIFDFVKHEVRAYLGNYCVAIPMKSNCTKNNTRI